MEEINKILEKVNLLFECESRWKQVKTIPFSAVQRKKVYGEIIGNEIDRITSSGRYHFHYKSADEELADLKKALELLDKNAKYLHDSDID